MPDHASFEEAVRAVQAYVRGDPTAHSTLGSAARRDPEGLASSLAALGAVLLDIAAGAFSLTADEMLDKVASRAREGTAIRLP